MSVPKPLPRVDAARRPRSAPIQAGTGPRAEAPPDDVLAARMGRGDLGALGTLYDRHATAIRRFVARAASPSEADDIVQGVFVRAMGRAETFDPSRGAARAWLFGIAARMVQEWRRSLARRARAFVRASADTSHERDGHDPSRRTDVERAIASLGEAKRIVVVLAEVEGFTSEEIARMLDIPVGTVWTRLHHARIELRARLGANR